MASIESSFWPFRTGSPGDDRHADDQTGQRRADLVGVGWIGLGGLADGRGQRAVEDLDLARLAVELEEDRALAVGVRLAHGQQLDDQGLARLDLDLDLLARLGPEEEDRRGQDRGVGIGPLVGGQIGEDARIEQVAQRIARRWRGGPAGPRPSRELRPGRPAAGWRRAGR